MGFICGLIFGGLALMATAEDDRGPKRGARTEAAYAGMDLLLDVLAHIHRHHLSPPEEESLWRGAAAGMVATLDPYSEFLDPDQYSAFKAETDGRYAGIGLELGVRAGRPTVISALDGGPASEAGVKAGDVIIRVDGALVDGLSLTEIIDRIRGPIDSPVRLELSREAARINVALTRREIQLAPVAGRLLGGDIALLRIRVFQRGTARALAQQYRLLEEAASGEIRAVILDLSDNPGGLLEEAVDVADLALDGGAVVITRRRGQRATRRSASAGGPWVDLPVAVVVNEGSASASEIVAGALRDHDRAVVIGQTTFGKGTVQSIYPVGEGSAMKITVARYLTPARRPIEAVGVSPDVAVPLDGDAIAVAEAQLRAQLRAPSQAGRGATP